MKVTVEIPDEEIREAVKNLLTQKIAKSMYDGWRGDIEPEYRRAIKDCVREALKDNIDSITNRAVEAAAKSIEYRGVKKLMEEIK